VSDFATIARSWLGTPWMPNGKVKGAGVSCQMLVGCIYKEAGLLPESITIPEGPMDWSVANKNSIIEPFIDGPLSEYFEPVERWPQPMDVMTFKIGGCGHHLGVQITSQTFIHILMHRTVIESRLDDASWLKRISRVWRPRT
jgi:cell wall-associated NlpC family hydrolase